MLPFMGDMLKLHIGLRRRLVGRPLVDRGLRDVLLADKFLTAPQLQSRIDFCCLCLGEIGALLLDRRLVGCLFDAEQEFACFDLRPFGEIAFLDEAGDPRGNVDLVDCRHTADEIACLRHSTAYHGVTVTAGGGGSRRHGVNSATRSFLRQLSDNVKKPFRQAKVRRGHQIAANAGILQWAVVLGCLDWQFGGLKPPQAVLAATAAYMEAEDATAAWIDENCERVPSAWESSTDLLRSWKVWAEAAGENPGTQKRFTQTLESRGFTRHKMNRGRGFYGLWIRRDEDVNRYWGSGKVTHVTRLRYFTVTRARNGTCVNAISTVSCHMCHPGVSRGEIGV